MNLIDALLDGSKLKRQLDAMQADLHTLLHQGVQIMALMDDLRAQLASLVTTTGNIETEVTTVATEVSDLIGRLSPGSTITQADVDALTSISTRLQAASAALQAIPAEPA